MVCCNVFFGFPLLTRCKDPERILNWGQNLYIEKLECYDNVSLYTLASYKFQVYLIISIHFINNWNWDFNLEKLYDPDAMISITPTYIAVLRISSDNQGNNYFKFPHFTFNKSQFKVHWSNFRCLHFLKKIYKRRFRPLLLDTKSVVTTQIFAIWL